VVDRLTFLESASVELFGKQFPLFRFLQHVSTVVGLAVLAAWLVNLKKTPAESDPGARVFAATRGERVSALLLMLALSAILGIGGYLDVPELSFGRRLFHGAIGGMTGSALAWITIAIFLQLRLRARRG
jgi:hypothetical protein